jgi:hypothetical protein
MTRRTYSQLSALSLAEAIAAARAELDAYDQDADPDHLYDAGALCARAANSVPRLPRVPLKRRTPAMPVGTPFGSITTTVRTSR